MRHISDLTASDAGWHHPVMSLPFPFLRSVSVDMRRRVAGAMVVLAVMMQALVPNGYMASVNPNNGSIAITLCTSSGMLAAFIDADGQISETKPNPQSPLPDTDDTNFVCAFTGHATSALVAPITDLSPQSQTFEVAETANVSVSLVPGLGLAAPPPPKTGPPIQA